MATNYEVIPAIGPSVGSNDHPSPATDIPWTTIYTETWPVDQQFSNSHETTIEDLDWYTSINSDYNPTIITVETPSVVDGLLQYDPSTTFKYLTAPAVSVSIGVLLEYQIWKTQPLQYPHVPMSTSSNPPGNGVYYEIELARLPPYRFLTNVPGLGSYSINTEMMMNFRAYSPIINSVFRETPCFGVRRQFVIGGPPPGGGLIGCLSYADILEGAFPGPGGFFDDIIDPDPGEFPISISEGSVIRIEADDAPSYFGSGDAPVRVRLYIDGLLIQTVDYDRFYAGFLPTLQLAMKWQFSYAVTTPWTESKFAALAALAGTYFDPDAMAFGRVEMGNYGVYTDPGSGRPDRVPGSISGTSTQISTPDKQVITLTS